MLMTNGLGATIGTLSAGAVIDHFCHWENGFLLGDWSTAWYIFAGFALVVAISFMVLFKYKHVPDRVTEPQAVDMGLNSPDGFVDDK